MAQAIESMDRGGRPPITMSPAMWRRVWQGAITGLTQEQVAASIGISTDTLKATRGFRAVWAVKKHAGEAAIAARLHSTALGDVAPAMPQAVTAMFLAKVRLGWREKEDARESELLAQAAATLAALFGRLPRPAQATIEGTATELPASDPAATLLSLLPEGEPDPGPDTPLS